MNTSIKSAYALLLLTLILSCKDKEPATSETGAGNTGYITVNSEQFNTAKMTLGSIEEMSFPEIVEATGMVEVPPENKAVASAFMGGYVKETPLLVGDVVKKGQALVVLENPEFITLQQDYLEASQQLHFLQAEYERQKQLLAENISSQKSFMKAESDYMGKLAQYNGLKEKLQMLNFSVSAVETGNIRSTSTIYAPISGSVTSIHVNKGIYVSPSDQILEITDTDHIHLELRVFEKDVMKLRTGQNILFRIPEASGETFEAEVYLIGRHIEDNRTVRVHGELKKEDQHRFLTGMFVEAEITTSETAKKALPSEAIAAVDNRYYVLKLVSDDGGTYLFERLEVRPGEIYDGYTALEDMDTVLEKGQFLIKGAFSLLRND